MLKLLPYMLRELFKALELVGQVLLKQTTLHRIHVVRDRTAKSRQVVDVLLKLSTAQTSADILRGRDFLSVDLFRRMLHIHVLSWSDRNDQKFQQQYAKDDPARHGRPPFIRTEGPP